MTIGVIFTVMNISWAEMKTKPEQELNPWPLQCGRNALSTELTNQLGADHFVGL